MNSGVWTNSWRQCRSNWFSSAGGQNVNIFSQPECCNISEENVNATHSLFLSNMKLIFNLCGNKLCILFLSFLCSVSNDNNLQNYNLENCDMPTCGFLCILPNGAYWARPLWWELESSACELMRCNPQSLLWAGGDDGSSGSSDLQSRHKMPENHSISYLVHTYRGRTGRLRHVQLSAFALTVACPVRPTGHDHLMAVSAGRSCLPFRAREDLGHLTCRQKYGHQRNRLYLNTRMYKVSVLKIETKTKLLSWFRGRIVYCCSIY